MSFQANVGEGRKLSVVGLVNFYLYLYKKVFFYWMVSVSSIISSKISCIYTSNFFIGHIICWTIESYLRNVILFSGKRAPFSSWAGKRSGEMPIYHQVPEYARCYIYLPQTQLSQIQSTKCQRCSKICWVQNLHYVQKQFYQFQSTEQLKQSMHRFDCTGGSIMLNVGN